MKIDHGKSSSMINFPKVSKKSDGILKTSYISINDGYYDPSDPAPFSRTLTHLMKYEICGCLHLDFLQFLGIYKTHNNYVLRVG